ncbi:hypothetical protein NBT05_10610 [Aquimarina sp. ERC-38]|nr:hypothetical protein NBT05_10610 [Aquimarina sp. ERC-38]
MRIMPLYLPFHRFLVYLSGGIEIIAAILLLLAATRSIGLWLVLILLILFIPVHIYMIQNKKASLNLPGYVLWSRLALQFLCIYWVYYLIKHP